MSVFFFVLVIFMEAIKQELKGILKTLEGTRDYEILCQMQELYSRIATVQAGWYEKSKFTCLFGFHDFMEKGNSFVVKKF